MQRWKFLSRLVKFRHLELDSAFQQVFWTVLDPKRLFRYHQNQNEMQGQWSRDDPSFFLLLCTFLAVTSLLQSVWMGQRAWGYILALLWAVLADGLIAAVLVATVMWLVASYALRKPGAKAGKVEWSYCFDVHLNSLFPLVLCVYGVQLVAWPLLARANIGSLIVANTLWSAGFLYYTYLTFLGYTALPSLDNTMGLLYVGLGVLFVYLFSLPLGYNYCLLFQSYHLWRTGGLH
ncbi:Protein unc-50 homolog [Geodia barretti]|uniref:Protein unc-50 homolog n=1 Tax=Geodia barretti TaxID=519541 RepID=A0AA35WSH4_GEOBA|nr:Protein unc-50 homolog [Geodia barretti]